MSVRARITRDPSRTGPESGVPREPQVRGRPSRHSRAKDKGRATAPGRLLSCPPAACASVPGPGCRVERGGTCIWPKGGSLTGPSLTPCDLVGGASPRLPGMLPVTAPHDSVPPQASGDFGSGLQASPELAGEEAVSAGLGRGGRRGTPPPSWCPAAGMPLKVGSASTCPLDSEVTWAADCPSGQP